MQIDRRALLGLLPSSLAVGLVGCGSEDGDGSDDGTGDAAVNRRPPASGLRDDRHLVVADQRVMALVDGGVGVWALTTGKHERTIGAEVTAGLSRSARSGRLAVGSTKGKILVLDESNGDVVATLTGHEAVEGAIEALCLTPDGTRLASAGGDGTVRLWSVADGTSDVLDVEGTMPRALALTPDGGHLAVAGLDAPVQVVSLDDLSVRTIQESPPQGVSLAVDPQGTTLVTTTADPPSPGKVVRVETSSWTTTDLVSDVSPVALAVSPDGSTLAVSDSGADALVLVPLSGGEQVTVPVEQAPRGIAWSDDGRLIVTAGADTGIVVREAATGEEQRRIDVA